MTPRSMTRPTAPATRKASGSAMASDQSKAAARIADDLLDDEGRIGAEHDHLAMRHVDDAHHAEGDGEADGGEQQHRAEREAVPDVLAGVPEREVAVDRAMPALPPCGSPRSRRRGAGSGSQRVRSPASPIGPIAATFSSSGRSEASSAAARARSIAARTPVSCLLRERRIERVERFRIRARERSSRPPRAARRRRG